MFSKDDVGKIEQITRRAGQMLAQFFADPEYRRPMKKADGSPVTRADQEVSDFLVEQLGHFGFPVISEEGEWLENAEGPYFIVDPLDGTKYFARGEKDFAVLVGFVEQQKPSYGFIDAPMDKAFYLGISGGGAFVNGQKIRRQPPGDSIVAYSSGFHNKPAREWICREMDIGQIIERGSALKFCDIAIGKADFFPRFGPTHEWDTAGAQVLLQESNCSLIDVRDGQPLRYGKKNRLNKGFIACHEALLPKATHLLEKHFWPKMESK